MREIIAEKVHIMNAWSLLAVVFVTWILWCVACIAQIAVGNASLPKDKQRGFSMFPAIPILPLVFWGLGVSLDVLFDPWGKRIIGTLHLLLSVVLLISILRDCLRVRWLRNNRSES